MNFKQMRYFVSVYEEGSFSRAAERENCTQPTLSAQIRNLEERLANPLFERIPSGVTPTLAGRKFYALAISILKSVEAARLNMREMSETISGMIHVGLVPSVVRGLLPGFLPAFVAEYPHVQVSFVEAYSATLTGMVAARELDFAVVIEPPTLVGLEMRTLSREQIVLISGTALGFTSWEPVKMADMAPLKLVIPTRRNSLGKNLHHFIQLGQIPAAQVMEMDAMGGSIEFVRETDWATILPFTAISGDTGSKSLRFNPITEPAIHSDFFLVHRTQNPLSAAAQCFIAALDAAMQATANSWQMLVKKTAG